MKKRIPVLSEQMTLTFNHLYDDNFGVVASTNGYGKSNLVLIMPSGFVPALNKSYRCRVSITNGNFTYKNRPYTLAVATMIDKGDVIDELDYKYGASGEKPKKRFSNNSFGALGSLIK